MAVPFCKMRPELRKLLAGAKAEIAALRWTLEALPLSATETAVAGSARQNLLRLAAELSAHEGVTHWAISMRLFGKGDFFHRLEKGGHPRSDTYEKALGLLSQRWPEDLEWPKGVERPAAPKQKGAA
ncbi:hypothetical protein [Sagittula sp. S175]|uniref:hypothetical protein n=1 Tax=Sagittula sp. S175 TaxID=3415129 RepID=UPI003C7A1959